VICSPSIAASLNGPILGTKTGTVRSLLFLQGLCDSSVSSLIFGSPYLLVIPLDYGVRSGQYVR
jgi:hypothetical protein